MATVTSRDGTQIAYDVRGQGPAVVLIGGGIVDRSENAPLAAALAADYTVYNYDRRGRGLSGDTAPYALAREVEDIEALIEAAGGRAHLYGVSSGGALALEAGALGSMIDCLAVYEVPYDMSPEWPKRWRAYVEQLDEALSEDRRGDAFALFMRLTGATEEAIASARSAPWWADMEAIAHTLAYDARCLGTGQPSPEQLARVTRPTLVLTVDGYRDAGADAWILALDPAAEAITASIADAERRTVPGQGHVAEPDAIAATLIRFFGRSS